MKFRVAPLGNEFYTVADYGDYSYNMRHYVTKETAEENLKRDAKGWIQTQIYKSKDRIKCLEGVIKQIDREGLSWFDVIDE